MKPSARSPAVAGRFYAATPGKLQKELEQLFQQAKPLQCDNVRAIISPHAGYIFSGSVAASAFNQVDAGKKYERIFVIGSSHQVRLKGAAVYTVGDYRTPLGDINVDTRFAEQLVCACPDLFVPDSDAHNVEHSLEVQLPFLQHVLGTDLTIVPIVIGTSEALTCKKIAKALAPYFTPENLFVISTDFSHYPQYADAVQVDTVTKNAILSNDPEILLKTLQGNAGGHIPGLSTSLCGWTSVLTLLYMTSGKEALKYIAIDYKNSGDAVEFNDKEQVVGYWAIAVCDTEFQFSGRERSLLRELARRSVESVVLTKKRLLLHPGEFPPALHQHCGAFVTLRQNQKLRGCIGRMEADVPLFELVSDMAAAAALYDDRFPPVDKNDLKDLDMEITVLSPLTLIRDIHQIELGKHGILVKSGGRSGVFLPQVATETGWSLEEFLGHCSRDKAGLGWEGWKSARIYTFTGQVF